MRTTIELPDDLFRRAKATAALRGLKLKDLFAQILEDGLRSPQGKSTVGRPRRILPVIVPANGVPGTAMSNAEIEELFMEEDLERFGLSRPS